VSHSHLVIYIKKNYLKAKEVYYGNLTISLMQKYNLQKKNPPKKRNPKSFKIIYYNSIIITNLKFQHKPKYHLSKILI